jgi:hypothetical protein
VLQKNAKQKNAKKVLQKNAKKVLQYFRICRCEVAKKPLK